MMIVLKMHPRKSVHHRIFAVKFDLIILFRSKTLANVVRPAGNWKSSYVLILIDTIVAGIMPFSFRHDIQAEVGSNGITHDLKQVLEVLDSAKSGRELMGEEMR